MCGHTLKDIITNDTIWENIGVAPIEGKMREFKLRWFGHVLGGLCKLQWRLMKRYSMRKKTGWLRVDLRKIGGKLLEIIHCAMKRRGFDYWLKFMEE